ncbi:type I-E CRISPR-associated protein Cas6/Cse3/CasE [Streptomyces longispororuber]|uniref:Type I-E CRISPR-associated protein Cas6/Cse3/CasE n=1 Tax=Streptomyces longispororuber TaxID=68230 RepID=A0A918ZYT5_9ACTN|nr:type I-E CRISPR-associated protein Cas6/Cse3/CasE [Streptomyces longispororuber]GHE78446.1 type I-E CRISPR-associated protein Cas6/Cse3/CasE [Streptomyces longispororuber]
MPYLSRIRINPLRAESRRYLESPRAVHGAVMGGLPDAADDERPLWRMDSDDPHRPHLVVLTRSRPDWSHVVEHAGWPGADGDHVLVRDYAPLLALIEPGRAFAFRLTANPVQNAPTPTSPTAAQRKRIAEEQDPTRRRGFRMAHRTAAEQLRWFLERTERWGFAVPASRTDPPASGLGTSHAAVPDASGGTRTRTSPDPTDPVPREVRITGRHRRAFTKNGRGAKVIVTSVTFEGRLEVTDAKALTHHLLSGIGPAKAYGCGLLTLAPVRSGSGANG